MVASVIASAGLGIAADIAKNIISDIVTPDDDKENNSVVEEIIDIATFNNDDDDDNDSVVEEIINITKPNDDEEISDDTNTSNGSNAASTAAPAFTSAGATSEEVAAFYNSLAMGNAISNQQAHQQLQLAITSKIVESIITTVPSEGIGKNNTAQLMELLGNMKNA